MAIDIQNDLTSALDMVGYGEKTNLLAMHLAEIESEAETFLDLLTTLRSPAYRADRDATEETLAELTISLEHLTHHCHEALPQLQTHLGIEES